jgi:hypothetical protein
LFGGWPDEVSQVDNIVASIEASIVIITGSSWACLQMKGTVVIDQLHRDWVQPLIAWRDSRIPLSPQQGLSDVADAGLVGKHACVQNKSLEK